VARVDYDREAVRYQAGRGVRLEDLDEWRDAVSRFLPAGSDPLLDVGAGTGIWLRAFSSWFDRPVVGLEPSRGMREVATHEGLGAGVMIAGRAQQIPLRTASCSAVWLSTVVHHLEDLGGCAKEMRRVLKDSAPVLIRNSFANRHDEIPLLRFFAGARRVANSFPSVEEVIGTFGDAGFGMVDLVRVHEPPAGSLAETKQWVERMRHTDSALAPLSEEEFAEGIRELDLAIAAGEKPSPLGLDLLVLR
jgi:ubiquinone/menaquinone biosynthesis C-methylase UbiE